MADKVEFINGYKVTKLSSGGYSVAVTAKDENGRPNMGNTFLTPPQYEAFKQKQLSKDTFQNDVPVNNDVNFSGSETSEPDKKDMSTGAKILIAAGVLAIGAVGIWQHKNISKGWKKFVENFKGKSAEDIVKQGGNAGKKFEIHPTENHSMNTYQTVNGYYKAWGLSFMLKAGEDITGVHYEQMQKIDKGLQEILPTRKPVTAYRFEFYGKNGNNRYGDKVYKKELVEKKFNSILNAKTGDYLDDKGYTFITTSKDYLKALDQKDNSKIIQYTINLPPGTKIITDGHFGLPTGLNEAILPRNSKLKVANKIEHPNGILELQCEYVLPNAA